MPGSPFHPNGCSPRSYARARCARCCRNGVFHLSICGRYFRPGARRPQKHELLSISSNATLIPNRKLGSIRDECPSGESARRTSISSILPSVQCFGALSKVTPLSGVAHPEPARRSVTPCPPQARIIRRALPQHLLLALPSSVCFRCCGIRSKQPSRSDFAFALARAGRSSPAYKGRTLPRTRFCRPGSASNRISMSNSIEIWSFAAAAEVFIPRRNRV